MLGCKDMHVRGARCTGGRLACAGAWLCARLDARRAAVRAAVRAAGRAGARLCKRARGCACGRAA
ncbi:hypothetical protein CRG98_048565, partial [Punica granatum]